MSRCPSFSVTRPLQYSPMQYLAHTANDTPRYVDAIAAQAIPSSGGANRESSHPNRTVSSKSKTNPASITTIVAARSTDFSVAFVRFTPKAVIAQYTQNTYQGINPICLNNGALMIPPLISVL